MSGKISFFSGFLIHLSQYYLHSLILINNIIQLFKISLINKKKKKKLIITLLFSIKIA
jgi:hypothetical protein